MPTQGLQALRLGALAAAVAATLSLAACDQPAEPTAAPPAEPTVGQRVDAAIADAREASQEARQAGSEAVAAVKQGASDAAITTEVNAALARDDKLSALQIEVDTEAGRVTLNGTAPDASSRDRATTLAAAVEGVTAVENRLTVKGS